MSTLYNLECSNKETTFGELSIGDCFFCNGNIFQKIKTARNDNSQLIHSMHNNDLGVQVFFKHDSKVTLIKEVKFIY